MSNILIECDPEKNTICDKKNCYIIGGPCKHYPRRGFRKSRWKNTYSARCN